MDAQPFAETQQFFVKQRAAIERLRGDNALLKEEVMLENRFSVAPTSAAAAAAIAGLQEQSEVYNQKIAAERARALDLRERLAALRATVAQQRRAMGGVNAARDGDLQARPHSFRTRMQKQIRTLENRLEGACHRHNARRAETRALRAVVDSLRRERLALDEGLRKLQRGLATHRRALAGLLQEAHAAGAGGERAHAQAAGLKLSADREQANSEAEWRQLTQLLEHARQQREAVRNREIQARDLQTMTVLSSEVAPRVRSASPASGGARTGAAAADRLRELGAAFDAVLAATGAADMDALAATIVAAEDTNFCLLSFVGAVNAEADALEASAADLRTEVAAAGDAAAAADAAQRAKTQELESRLAETEASASAFEARRRSAAVSTSRLREGLASLWQLQGGGALVCSNGSKTMQSDKLGAVQRAGCDTPAVRALLGSGGPTDASLMQFLGVLEQRTHELMQAYVAKVMAEGPGQQNRARALLAPPSAPHAREAGAPVAVDPPSTVPGGAPGADGGDGSGADDDDQPLDRQALYQRVQRSLARHAPAAATPQAKPRYVRSGALARRRGA